MSRYLVMIRNILIILGVFSAVIGCKESNFVTNKDDNGKITEKYAVNKENQKHGEYLSYINGVLSTKANYKNGKLHGERLIYHTNGQVEIEESYEDDVLVGLYKSYSINGTLVQEANYKKGVMQGMLKTYYNDGHLKEEVTMVDNQENGPFKEYHPNGKIKWEGEFLNGDNEYGLLKNYNEAGELIKKMMCNEQGVCSTIWTIEEGDVQK